MAATEAGHETGRWYADRDGHLHVNSGGLYLEEGSTGLLTATAAELNRVADLSSRVVIVAAATTSLTLTVTEHGDKLIVLNTNNATGIAIAAPVAVGTGAKFEVINNVAQTQGTIVITCGTSIMSGTAFGFDSTAVTAQAECFVATATDKVITLNRTTTGGLKGDRIQMWDITANQYLVDVKTVASGNVATPFSAT